MNYYSKADMLFTYEWSTREDDPALRGEPDSSLFNRHQGWEVLYMINKIMAKKGYMTVSTGNKIERLIKEHLPSDVRSQERVIKWVEERV